MRQKHNTVVEQQDKWRKKKAILMLHSRIYDEVFKGFHKILLHIGSFPGVKCGRGVLLTTHPILVPRSWKSRAITLPTL